MHAGVLPPDFVPEPGHHDQECPVSDREAPASAACVGRVHGEDGENADLEEEIRARPPVKPAMQLEIQRTVCPRDPGQREDDREFEKSVRREVSRQLISRLRDDGGVGKVIEKLERTDTTIDDRFAVRTRRTPEPVLEKLKRPTGRRTRGSSRPVGQHIKYRRGQYSAVRTIVLVEGVTDELALTLAARRSGRDLEAEGVSVVPINGAHAISRFLRQLATEKPAARLAG